MLRRDVLRGLLGETRARRALEQLALWPVRRVPHRPFLIAAFNLRQNYSSYDALYVAVAQAYEASVLTCDERLSRAPAVPGVQIRRIE